MEQFTRSIGQYVITALMVIGGVGFLIKYLSGDDLESQPVAMLFASIILIVVGILIAPPVMAKFSSTMSKVLLVVGLLAGIALAYQVYYSIAEEIQFQEKKAAIEARTIQRLKDIRDAQEAFADYNGRYANSFDTLLSWIQEPVIPIPFKMGTFHDSLPEVKAYEEGYVIRRNEVDSIAQMLGKDEQAFLEDIDANRTAYKIVDTLYTSFYAENFAPEARQSKRLPQVSLDSLPYAPFKGERFVMKTDVVEKGGVKQPTILVQDPTPFGREKVKKDTLRFGSLTEPHTDGNWK
jgi:hypothetical protein